MIDTGCCMVSRIAVLCDVTPVLWWVGVRVSHDAAVVEWSDGTLGVMAPSEIVAVFMIEH